VSHTLLLADDSLTIQRVIELTFADEDVNVVTVSDGDEAIAIMDRTPPDIVLADVGMPGRNGYEVAEHIRDTPRLAHIPIVLLTGAFESIDQAKATAVGCDGVLAKPFEPQLVIGRVRELLAKPKPSPSPDSALPEPLGSDRASASEPPESVESPAVEDGEAAGDYFERLDQAFATLSARPGDVSGPDTLPSAGEKGLDWFASQAPPAETLASAEPARPDYSGTPGIVSVGDIEERSASTPGSPTLTPAPPARWSRPWSVPATPSDFPSPDNPPAPATALDDGQNRRLAAQPAAAPTLPPLADAFVALLAAEQSMPPSPISARAWPSLQPMSPGPAAVADEVVEAIARRVLDQLTDRVVREAVEEKVTAIAERLIREEIERLKASLK
jgi:CheY-like chemotaxis protein